MPAPQLAAVAGITVIFFALNGLLWYSRPSASLWLVGSLSLGIAWGFVFQWVITRAKP